jgi:hypothetical protein
MGDSWKRMFRSRAGREAAERRQRASTPSAKSVGSGGTRAAHCAPRGRRREGADDGGSWVPKRVGRPLHLRKRLRSTNLLERSLEEVKRRTKVIGRFPGETSCLSLCWAVLDLFIASARGLALTALEHRQLAQMRAGRRTQTPESLSA